MKRALRSGFTLVEVLIVLGILGVIGVVLVAVFAAGQRAFAAQRARTELAQNAAVAVTLLQQDLRTAGSPGALRDTPGASVDGAAFLTASTWPFTPTPALNTLLVTPSSASCHTTRGCDMLSVTRVSPRAPLASFAYRLEQVTYTAKRDSAGEFNLYRRVLHFNCLAVQAGASACTADAGNERTAAQPAVAGVEEFQVFFLDADAKASEEPQPGGTDVNATRAVGVYLRLRAPRADGRLTDTRTYPTVAFPFAGSVGIPSVTYSGVAARYRRSEQFFTVSLPGAQSVK